MKDVTQEQRWAQWMVQARNFAAKEQFHDAVMRMKLVREEVAAELSRASEPDRREHLLRTLHRVDRQLASIGAKKDEWTARIARERAERMAHASDEMKRPLPEGLPGRART